MPRNMESQPNSENNSEKKDSDHDEITGHQESEEVREFKRELKEEITPDKIAKAIKEAEEKFEKPERLELKPETKELLREFQSIGKEIVILDEKIADLKKDFNAMPGLSRVWQNIKAIAGFKSNNIEASDTAIEKRDLLLKELQQILKKVMEKENLTEDQLMALAEKLEKGEIEI